MNCGKNQAELEKNINVKALALLSKIQEGTPIICILKLFLSCKGKVY